MSVTIFVWEPSLLRLSIGHASLSTSDPKNYMSWWPHGENSFRADRSAEGILPSYASAPIDGLDEIKINKRWNDFVIGGKYQMIGTLGGFNCATAVLELLEAGGLYDVFPKTRSYLLIPQIYGRNHPIGIKNLADYLNSYNRGNCKDFPYCDELISRT